MQLLETQTQLLNSKNNKSFRIPSDAGSDCGQLEQSVGYNLGKV